MSAVALVVLVASALVPAAVVAGLLAIAGALPPAPVAATANRVLVVAAVATVIAVGVVPAGGLLVPPILPVPVACLAFGVVVRLDGELSTLDALAWIPVAVGVGVVAVLVRGVAVGGPSFVGHVFRPPSLVGSAVALSATTLSFYPLGRTARTGARVRWLLAAAVVALPPATVLMAIERPFNLVGLLVPGTFALIAVLFGVPVYRLGHAVATRERGTRTAGTGP